MSLIGYEIGDEGVEADGVIRGVAVGLVTQNQDPDGLARVRVSFPWHAQSDESYWARLATPMAGASRGMYFLPEVGDEVLVAFDRGHIGHPFVIGSLWNGKDKPPESNADGRNAIRKIHSRAGHELLFDDEDPGKVVLQTAGGKRLVMDDQQVELSDENGNSVVIGSTDGSMALSCNGALTIEALSVKVSASTQLEVTSSGTVTISGTLIRIN